MTDSYEIIPTPAAPEPVRPPVKWLQYLFYVHIAALVVSLTALISVELVVTPWLLTAGTAVCIYSLSCANLRYRKAAVLTAISLGLQVLSLLMLSNLLTLTASILTIIASYQEFCAHAETAVEKDPQLAKKWKNLFIWQIIIGVLSGLSSVAAVVIMVMANMEQAQIIQLVSGAIVLVALIPGSLYLVYLRRMIRIFET